MTTKSREVGIKVHNSVATASKSIWKGLKAAGKGVKVAAVSVKEVTVGAVTGRTGEEQKQLELDLKIEKAERMHLDPSSKLYRDLTSCDDRR